MGEPLVNVEIADEQIYLNIDLAIEYFTKYAGYTEEYLLFGTESENTEVQGIEFLGSRQECEIEINRLNLSYTQLELPQEEIQTEPVNVDNEVIYSEDNSEANFIAKEIKLDSFE